MQDQYIGFRVRLKSSQLGDVVGTVSGVSESKIELTDARVNDMGGTEPSLSVESQFIEELRILATSNWTPSADVTPSKAQEKTQFATGRAHRREMLRNIPNACNAYVCPDSPPIIRRSAGAPSHTSFSSSSPRQKVASGLQQLDSALADVTLNERKSNKYGGSGIASKRRSYSMSETHAASSDVSGAECDFSHATHNPPSRGLYQNGSRYHNSKSHSRTGQSTSRGGNCGGSASKQVRADWDHVRVEEFMDQDFDFEKNLAMFDKTAFYEMVDMRKGVTPKSASQSHPIPSSTQLDEGPDGVGRPLIGTTPHSERVPLSTKDYYDGSTMTTNTATLSSSRQRREHLVPYYHPSLQPPSIDSHSTSLCTCSNIISTSHLTQSVSNTRWWYSPTGSRIPVLLAEDHHRMLHYLATGIDPANLSAHSAHPISHGLSWGRVLESAGRSLVDYIMGQLRHAISTPQRIVQKAPVRILLLACGSCLSGAFTVTLARLLATRGACVVLLAPKISLDSNADEARHDMDLVYQHELNLCAQLAPRPNLYGLEEDDPFRTNYATDDDEEDEPQQDVDERASLDKKDSPVVRPASRSDGDSEPASCMTLDQLSSRPNDALDYSPLARMWISRIPGLQRVRRSVSVLRLPTNIRIDMVIVGHSFSGHSNGPPLDPQVIHWLQRHNALNCLVHLMPHCTSLIDQYGLRTASTNWVVELGLPRLVPSSHADCVLNSATTSHLLVDIGLSRNLVRRLTSDLKSLPPYGLFDVGSVLPLHSTVPTGSN